MAKTDLPSNSSVLAEVFALQERVAERIRELEPFADELTSLREQAERMGIDTSAKKATRVATGKTAKAPAAKAKRAPAKPRRRRKSGESRGDQVVKLVNEEPGITIPAAGEALGVDATGLYRVVKKLEQEGQLRKDGRKLQPVEQTPDLVESVTEGTTAD